ncbi:MAG TPA: 3'(2'),5'-bisphosphate nucleotidase CysQ [Trebonia sp.]|nr:3'(2'),5'-bisphosphate nucleotidase CysQ [Trebonia sp.]
MASDDHALARELAEEAGQLLLGLREQAFAAGTGPDELRKAGDRQSHELIAERLAARRPADALLSEEGVDDKARLSADRAWIVDPLDGTREFGLAGRSDWAVHVALWERARGGLTAGTVALPAQGRVLSTPEPGPRPGEGHQPLRLVVSQSRAPQLVRDVAARVGAELVPYGSAGAKVATVVFGETDAYLHAGGFYEWDTAAPVAVAVAAGFHVSRVDGSPVAYNREDPLLPDILVCRPAIAAQLLEAIREVTHEN